MKEFATNLKRIRESEGLTQQDLAKELGIPLKTYRNWESVGTGHRTPDVKVMIKSRRP